MTRRKSSDEKCFVRLFVSHVVRDFPSYFLWLARCQPNNFLPGRFFFRSSRTIQAALGRRSETWRTDRLTFLSSGGVDWKVDNRGESIGHFVLIQSGHSGDRIFPSYFCHPAETWPSLIKLLFVYIWQTLWWRKRSTHVVVEEWKRRSRRKRRGCGGWERWERGWRRGKKER